MINMYAVLDEKLQAFRDFRFSTTHGVAIRGFSDAVRDPKYYYFAHPEDYSLYFIGLVNDENGFLEPIVPIQLLSRGSEHIRSNGQVTNEVQS